MTVQILPKQESAFQKASVKYVTIAKTFMLQQMATCSCPYEQHSQTLLGDEKIGEVANGLGVVQH